MKLTDHQQKMLDGAFGKGKAMAMQIQIGVGKCFDAERLVPVSRAHVSLSAQEADIWFAGKLLDAGASCAIAPTVNPGYSVDYFRSRLTDAAVENMRKTERIYRGLGARNGLTAVHRNARRMARSSPFPRRTLRSMPTLFSARARTARARPAPSALP